ncbi:helix-turn-helix domain-containing protein [Nonomuraea sp. ATR24]|uniref:ATP-binding protein n=1 Tax=Nonomuraea sp. ATR24 TaxID=1676744 RepID=UPI0035C06983
MGRGRTTGRSGRFCLLPGKRAGVSDSFGALLRAHRLAADLTIEGLSHASGVSVRAIGDMERGVSRGPQGRTVAALAEALRLSQADRDALLAAARAGRPRAAPSTAGICELPRGVGDFTGRERELGVLRDLATRRSRADETAAIVTISGTAGMGKSALAVHAAGQLADLFPDGRFFLDLRGMDAIPLTSSNGLSQLLRALGVAERNIPADEQEGAGHYRALLRERRCLIVLDNAESESHVRPLLPGDGPSMVLITSRRPLAGLEGARQIPLTQLAGPEAAELLRAIVGEARSVADLKAVDELARLCGHLPLAIRIAGNRLQSRPGWTIRQLTGRLADEDHRLDALAAGGLHVAAAFALSYEQLTPAARQTFRRLALAVGSDFGIPMTAVLTQLDVDDAEDALEELVDLGLLSSPYAGRYRFHDLVRLYARARLEQEEPAQEREASRSRMESWLLEVAVAAGRWFEPEHGTLPPERRSLVALDSRAEARAWLQAEGAAWLEALRSAARRGEHTTVVEVAGSMKGFPDQWPKWGHWAEVFTLSTEAARATGDRREEAAQLNQLAWTMYVCEGRTKDAETFASRALELAREVGDLPQQGVALVHLAWALRSDPARLEQELEHARQGARLALRGGDLKNYPQAVLAEVHALRRAGRPEDALERNLALVAELRDPAFGGFPIVTTYMLGAALGHLGTTYLTLQRWEEAVEAYQQAMPQLSVHPLPFSVALTQHRLGTALRCAGRIAEARHALAEAARLYEEEGDGDKAAEVLKELEAAQ